ncbi:MAG: carbon-nitrogen hydrolase family protein [Proteobacteria bacterium]|jgi:nitrilase|nr:carbon-nitrogen hydrolase family protein [Pseudomonadota bacterium]
MQPFRAAAIQMVSAASVEANIAAADALVAEAASAGARLVALPENWSFMGRGERDKLSVRERDGSGAAQDFLSRAAKRHGVWIVGGSIPMECGEPDKVANVCLVYDEAGRRAARYDKIHLFGFQRDEERYDEAASVAPGRDPVAVDAPVGRIGLSICYDLRFPELYRSFGAVDLITVPSAFTYTTGAAHWETLLRARAIENLAWVIAPAQGGTHASGRRTWGHTMIVDPWGTVRAELAEGPGVIVADIDPAFQAEARASLPALRHRVL